MSFFLIAVPMFLLETGYGQLIEMPLQYRWGAIFPRVWGLKIVQVFICYFLTSYYVLLMAWSFSMFFDSFRNPLPWVADATSKLDFSKINCSKGCTPEESAAYENLKAAIGKGETQFSEKDLDDLASGGNTALVTFVKAQLGQAVWNEDYFYKETLRKSKNIQEQGGLVGHLVLQMFISYALIYACCFKGLQSSGKMAYITCLSPYVILGILLIKGFTLQGSGDGIKYLFIPNEEKFARVGQATTWKTAATQILFSSGVAYGPFMYYGTARGRNDSLIGASLWIPAANSLTSIYAAFTIFSFLGHVSYVTGKEIS